MTDAQSILVVFLSTALAIFLVLGIIFLALLIDIAQRVRRLSVKAEELADQAGAAAEFIRHATVPIAVSKLFAAITGLFRESSKNKDKE